MKLEDLPYVIIISIITVGIIFLPMFISEVLFG